MTRIRSIVIAILAGICILCSGAGSAWCAFSNDDTGTCAAQFLKIGVGARAVAMGGAYETVADDAFAVYWNPAGLTLLTEDQLAFNYTAWLLNLNQGSFAYVHPLSSLRSSFGFGVTCLASPKIDKYDASGYFTGGDFTAADTAVMFSWSTILADTLSGGVSLKGIRSSIDDAIADAVAVDAGILCDIRGQSFSLVVQNAGTGMKFVGDEYPLPMSIRLGTARPLFGRRLLLGCSIDAAVDEDIYACLGGEYTKKFGDGLEIALRGGVRSNARGLDSFSALSAGFGIRWQSLSLDFGWAPYGDLGQALQTSLVYRFRRHPRTVGEW